MKKDSKKTIMIIALISIVLCGCPGCFLLARGLGDLTAPVVNIQTFDDLLVDLGAGFMQGGWLICVSGLLILIPFVLVIIAVLKQRKEEALDELVPTGVSKEDPIPPPS